MSKSLCQAMKSDTDRGPFPFVVLGTDIYIYIYIYSFISVLQRIVKQLKTPRIL